MRDESRKLAIPDHFAVNDAPLCSSFSSALGTLTEGRMVFASGAAHLWIDASAHPTQLFSAHFAERLPNVRVQDGVVTIHYHRDALWEHPRIRRAPHARIGLNARIPWEIEFREAVAALSANLTPLQIRALDMGSVSGAHLILPAPQGTANLYLSGSGSDLMLCRPQEVAMRLHIAGASSHLMLDGQHIGAGGSGLLWCSANYSESVSRYDVRIAGSVSHVTIDEVN